MIMKKARTRNLIGPALDWAVEKAKGTYWCSGNGYFTYNDGKIVDRFYPFTHKPKYTYSTDWATSSQLLSTAGISRTWDHSGLWVAYWTDGYGEDDTNHKWMHCDKSELIAGLRCFVESKLGKEIEIPDYL